MATETPMISATWMASARMLTAILAEVDYNLDSLAPSHAQAIRRRAAAAGIELLPSLRNDPEGAASVLDRGERKPVGQVCVRKRQLKSGGN